MREQCNALEAVVIVYKTRKDDQSIYKNIEKPIQRFLLFMRHWIKYELHPCEFNCHAHFNKARQMCPIVLNPALPVTVRVSGYRLLVLDP